MTKFLVCIDPGHGGHDPGAVGNGLREKDIVLDIGLRCRDLLADYHHHHIDTLMTRDKDVFVPIGTRVRISNEAKADVFVSIHVNGWDTPRPHGFEIYSRRNVPGGDKSWVLKRMLYRKLSPIWIAESSLDRGKKQADYQVIRTTNCPAVLIEHGFISSPHDASLLKRDDFLQAQAVAIVDGIKEFAQYIAPAPGQTAEILGELYRLRVDGDQIGAYRNADNIATLAKNHIQQGAQQIVIERV